MEFTLTGFKSCGVKVLKVSKVSITLCIVFKQFKHLNQFTHRIKRSPLTVKALRGGIYDIQKHNSENIIGISYMFLSLDWYWSKPNSSRHSTTRRSTLDR